MPLKSDCEIVFGSMIIINFLNFIFLKIKNLYVFGRVGEGGDRRAAGGLPLPCPSLPGQAPERR
ncbi:hypothetical protein [Azotobacter vinelandii]